MAFKLRQEGNRVVLDLMGRRRDLLLSCAQAEVMVRGLLELAREADRAPLEILTEDWKAQVRAEGGLVAVRLIPPFGATDRVALPPPTARAIARQVEFARLKIAYEQERGAWPRTT